MFHRKSIIKNPYKVKTEKIIAHSADEIVFIALVNGNTIARIKDASVMTQSRTYNTFATTLQILEILIILSLSFILSPLQ